MLITQIHFHAVYDVNRAMFMVTVTLDGVVPSSSPPRFVSHLHYKNFRDFVRTFGEGSVVGGYALSFNGEHCVETLKAIRKYLRKVLKGYEEGLKDATRCS